MPHMSCSFPFLEGERELDTDEAVLRSGCFVTVGLEIRQQQLENPKKEPDCNGRTNAK